MNSVLSVASQVYFCCYSITHVRIPDCLLLLLLFTAGIRQPGRICHMRQRPRVAVRQNSSVSVCRFVGNQGNRWQIRCLHMYIHFRYFIRPCTVFDALLCAGTEQRLLRKLTEIMEGERNGVYTAESVLQVHETSHLVQGRIEL